MEPLLSQYTLLWGAQYHELRQQREKIDEAMAALEALITASGGSMPGTDMPPLSLVPIPEIPATAPSYADYDRKGSWAYKIEYVLAANGGPPIPVTEIAASINRIEPEMDAAKIIKAVTMEASKLGLNGRLGIKKKGNKNFYFLPKQQMPEQSTISFE